jgi:hypothetical protein
MEQAVVGLVFLLELAPMVTFIRVRAARFLKVLPLSRNVA